MKRLLTRFLQRVLVVAVGILSIWLIAFVFFDFADRQLPAILALAFTYAVGAYIILPRAVRMCLKILHRKKVPRYTITGDGLPGDPVNLVLTGTLQSLRAAYATAGWTEADRLDWRSALRMCRAFVFNSAYPGAPFSTLYLFGRGQDIGFEKAIGNSPRKRHHVRYWALKSALAEDAIGTIDFWLNTDRPPVNESAHWVGAGTKDTGFALTKLTFKITHATDADTNAERDFIIADLQKHQLIGEIKSIQAGQRLPIKFVRHYISDGDIAAADLVTSGGVTQAYETGRTGASSRTAERLAR